ncbi:MAG: hypothetical protein GYA23_08150, partial [Methanomicrobiales archaeon]|nr:hypothetical protein [Methanomicrobiales archaeon]
MADTENWEAIYQDTRVPAAGPALTGFNVNIDQIITMTPQLLDHLNSSGGKLAGLRSRLIHAMEQCTAEEWIPDDMEVYEEITTFFSRYGSTALGGQAGIAAVHLKSLGIPEVFCIAPAMGEQTAGLVRAGGAAIPGTVSGRDMVHTILEYPPGLVPPAPGTVPRNNRFIISPQKSAATILLPKSDMVAIRERVSSCTRAFLSGYQYLSTIPEFSTAADQIRALKEANTALRVHIECVSVADRRVNDGIVKHILPAADSAGMNEHELTLLTGKQGDKSPAGRMQEILDLARATDLSRIHLHTYGYYLLVIKKSQAPPESSRAALLHAARVVARVAGRKSAGITPEGIAAVMEVADTFP